MKKIKFPSAQTILLLIAAMVTLLTWIVPAGKYDQLSYEKSTKTFKIISSKNSKIVDGTTKTLDSLGIKIPIEKFSNGDIWKPINIPNTYKELDAKPRALKKSFKKTSKKGVANEISLLLFSYI